MDKIKWNKETKSFSSSRSHDKCMEWYVVYNPYKGSVPGKQGKGGYEVKPWWYVKGDNKSSLYQIKSGPHNTREEAKEVMKDLK